MKRLHLFTMVLVIGIIQLSVCKGGNGKSDTIPLIHVKKPPQVSFYYSTFSGGPQDDIRNAISHAGFGDNIPDQTIYFYEFPLYTIPGINYPIDDSRTSLFSIAIQDVFFKEHGGFIELTAMSQTLFEGFHIIDPINYTGLNISASADATLLSFGYMAATMDGVGMLKIGPSMAFAHTYFDCTQDMKINKMLPGIHVNGEVHLINKPVGFIGIQMGYRGYRKLQTPATVLHTYPDGSAITLPETTIDYNHIYFGLNAGVNLNRPSLKTNNNTTPQ